MIDLCVVSDSVTIASSNICNGNRQCVRNLKRHVLGTLTAKSALIIATPCVNLSMRGESYGMHATADDLHDAAGRVQLANVEEWDLPWAFYLAWLVISQS